jgi:hypothetical protein
MQNLKDKMYNYEVKPPLESWQTIADALDKDERGSSQLSKKRSKIFYFSVSIAAVAGFVIFGLIFWNYNGSKNTNEVTTASSEKINNNASPRFDEKITVPKITSDEVSDKKAANENNTKSETNSKYITISGPQGQPVKISAKVATLIVSSDNQTPPKPVWSSKVKKWKDIMNANVLAPTAGNFLDIVELTHALKVDN